MGNTENVGAIAVDLMVNSKGGVDGMNAFASVTGVTDERVNKLNQSIPGLNRNMGMVTNSSGQARQAMMGFSQIIQDAPYGIRGVGNNIEFFTQAMTQLMATTGGTGGALKAMLGVLSGPAGLLFLVSAAVSVLTMLSMKFGDVKDAAGEAKSGVDDFVKAIGEMGIGGLTELSSGINQRLDDIKARRENILKSQPVLPPGDVSSPEEIEKINQTFFKNKVAQLNALKAEEERLTVLKSKTDEQLKSETEIRDLREIGNKLLAENYSEIEKIHARQREITGQLQTGKSVIDGHVLSAKELRRLKDESVRLGEQERKLTQSTKEAEEERKKKAEGTKAEAKKLVDAEASATGKKMKAIMDYYSYDKEQQIVQLSNLMNSVKYEENREKVLERIKDVMGEINKDIIAQNKEVADSLERTLSSVENDLSAKKITVTQAKQTMDFLLKEYSNYGELTGDQQEKIRRRIAVLTGKEIEDRIQGEKDIQREQDKQSQKQLQDIDDLISATDRLGNALHRALGKSGDDFIQKMLSALQIAAQIAKTLKKVDMEKQGFGLDDVLGLVGNVVGLVGSILGFDSGGYTGGGSKTQVAGVVHRGEIVFEKPLVDRFGGDLMALRGNLQRATTMPGYAVGGLVGGGSAGYDMSAGVIAELRALRIDVKDIQIQQPIIFKNMLNFQQILREEMAGYEEFKRSKSVS